MKSLTNTEEMTLDQVRDQIAKETGVSKEDQALHCFEQAYVWMEKTLQADQHGLQMLPLQPGFWPWWCTHWEAVDRAFVRSRMRFGGQDFIQVPGSDCFRSIVSDVQMQAMWERYHDTSYVRGNQALLERSFHEYVKSAVKH